MVNVVCSERSVCCVLWRLNCGVTVFIALRVTYLIVGVDRKEMGLGNRGLEITPL